MITVIYQNGNAERPENYRPVCTLATWYKVWSTLLQNRLYSKLDRDQPPDQGGFRCGFQSTDHLMTYRLLNERSQVWGLSMWIATIDFAKAFDTIHHEAMWRYLSNFKISEAFVSVLKNSTLTNVPQSVQTLRVMSSRLKGGRSRVTRYALYCLTRYFYSRLRKT